MKALENKVVVVTGAGKGIGRGIAFGLANAGAKVCCSARTESQIVSTASTIMEAGGIAMHATCDVADLQSVELLFRNTEQQFGGVDIVVVNAGIQPDGASVEAGKPDEWKSIIDTNLMGAYYTIRTAIPYLRKSSAGKVIVIGSGAGHRANANTSAYSCSKAALLMLVKVLAQELAPFNISVNELVPGPVDTDILRSGATAAALAQLAELEWFKQPEEVVPLALFLATQPAKGPTGQTFSLTRREI